MNLFILYDKCSTCKKAKKWLEENNVDFESRPIKEQNPTKEELIEWHKKSGMPRQKFVNTCGQLYRDMNLKDKLPAMSDDEFFEFLATDGMLVKRPILVTDNGVATGFKEEIWQQLLNK